MTLSRFVTKNAFRNKRRSVLTVLSIGVSLLLLTFMMTMWHGFYMDKGSAESVVSRLKGKGFAAFVVAAEGDDGLILVRVGSYAARADAERVEAKLRDQEKFKPYIVKN